MKFLPFFITLLWLMPIKLIAQTLNQKDGNGKKTGKWVIYHKGTKTVFEEGIFVNGRKDGTWKRYFPDGKNVMIEAYYKNNRPNGSYTKYYQNGKIKERGTLVLNQYKDSLTKYYPNGNIEYRGTFNSEGKEQGKIVYYYENGKIEYEYQAMNGTPSGSAIRYFENGTIKEELNYDASGGTIVSKKAEKSEVSEVKKDQPVKGIKAPQLGTPRTRGKSFLPNGYNKCYTENDEIWQDGIFKNSQLWDGKLYEYDKDGILIRVKIFKNGVYHSNGQL